MSPNGHRARVQLPFGEGHPVESRCSERVRCDGIGRVEGRDVRVEGGRGRVKGGEVWGRRRRRELKAERGVEGDLINIWRTKKEEASEEQRTCEKVL